MAIKQIMLSKKIESARSELKLAQGEYAKTLERSKTVEKAIEEAQTEEELRAVEDEVNEVSTEVDNKAAKIKEIEDKIAELEKELEELQNQEPKPKEDERGGKKDMTKRDTQGMEEYKEAANAFLRSKGKEQRDGLKSDEVGVLIPQDINYVPQHEKDSTTDLAQFVTVLPVKSRSGKYLLQKRSKAKMHTVEELQENPELAKPEFIPVNWTVDTYRGMIAISQESIDDSEADLVGIVNTNAEEQRENTSNDLISKTFQSFTKKELVLDENNQIALVDSIKQILNVDLDPAYDKSFIVSQSLFQILDTLKDKDGRYLLQPDITKQSDGIILNKTVHIVLDEQIQLNTGTEAAPVYEKNVGFIGDSKYAVLMPKRAEISAKWADDKIYGEYVATGIRFGVTKADPDAGFFLVVTKSGE